MLCIYRVREQSEVDENAPSPTTSSLFKPQPKPSRCRRTAAISADSVTACIGLCSASEWTVLSAVVVNNSMYVCRKSRTMGDTFYVLLRSHGRSVRVPSGGRGTIVIPSFVCAAEMQCLVANGGNLAGATVGRSVDCRPVCTLVRSEKHRGPRCGCTITSELFLSLFGPELQLSNAPVMLVGCQNGNVYFVNPVRSSVREKESSKHELMCPLYNLAQPVVSIHTVYFPTRKPLEADDPFQLQEASPEELDTDKPHNAILFLGQAGKIAICYISSDGQSFPSFLEFHTPAPVVSSVLFPGRCLLYSTLKGLYRICLRRDCATFVEEKLPPTHSLPSRAIEIPEVSFKFPHLVQSSHYGAYLLQSGVRRQFDPSSDRSRQGEDECLSLSLDGQLSTLHFTNAKEEPLTKTSAEVGQEMKECLRSIQAQGEMMDRVVEKIQSLNGILTELKGVLDMLCAVGKVTKLLSSTSSHDKSPFSCSFRSTWEKVGAVVEKLCVVVEMTYSIGSKHKAVVLGEGWSLLVVSQQRGEDLKEGYTAKSIPLAGLVAGDSVSLKVDVDVCGGGECVKCFLHYNPRHLYECLTQHVSTSKSEAFKSISLSLARKDVSVLDFLHPQKRAARETLSSCRSRTVKALLLISISEADTTKSAPTPAIAQPAMFPALLHSSSLPIPLDAAVDAIRAGSSKSTEELRNMGPDGIAAALLVALVPAVAGKKPSRAGGGGGNTGTRGSGTEVVTAFDGEVVSFKLIRVEEDGGLRLDVCASSRRLLVQVIGAVSARLRRRAGGRVVESHDHTTLCGRLRGLERILEDIGHVLQEISATHQEWRTNCLSAESYRKALHAWREKASTIYCKLRKVL